MKLRKIFQMVANLLPVIFILTSCSQPRPIFQSDEYIISKFQNHKKELTMLMQKCKNEQKTQGFKRHTFASFSICKIDQKKMKGLIIQELSTEFKGSRVLFITDQYTDDYANTLVEEKGYIFSAAPITQDLIKEGLLDQFTGKELFEKRGSNEKWRYRQIEPNWYIYYRQYFYPFMG